MNNNYITVKDAAEQLHLTRARVCDFLRAGRIKGRKPGGRDWEVDRDSLAAFAALERRGGRPRKSAGEAGADEAHAGEAGERG